MKAWTDFVKRQEEHLGKEVAEKWLHSLKVVHFDSANLYLEAQDAFQVAWFEEHIRPLLKLQLLNNNFRQIKVHLTATTSPLQEKGEKKEKKTEVSNPPIHFSLDKLDPSLSLENFIPGEANKVVFRLCSELVGQSKGAALAFNPIYLWGGSGCGKTHLLMALTTAFKTQGLNALYARAETFTGHVVAAIRGSEMLSFRKHYRHADVLLIDDVHLFARKDATQEELFHTFNTLHSAGKQIILSAHCAPALLKEIEPRLVSRFEWGINIHFETLSPHELKTVLERRCATLQFPLSDEVSDFLICAFPSSKSLGRALEALVLRSHLTPSAHPNTPEEAKHILGDLWKLEQENTLNPQKIATAVASAHGIRPEDLLGKSQTRECSVARQMAMYLCREDLRLPYQEIGRIFGRDHSTVMSGIKQIEKRIEASDGELLTLLLEVRAAHR